MLGPVFGIAVAAALKLFANGNLGSKAIAKAAQEVARKAAKL